MNKQKLRNVIFLIGLFVFFFVQPLEANASIFNIPRGKVASEGLSIDSKYTFIPEFTSRSTIKTFGSGWKTTDYTGSDKTKFFSNDVSSTSKDNLKGKIGATYTNVGYYNGQSIDLKITINNWNRYGVPSRVGNADRVGNISFEKTRIAVSTQGYNWVDMTWTYVKSGTSTEVPVSGYFTFSDVDVNQYIQFSKASSEKIDQYVVSNRNNKLKYSSHSGEYRISDSTDIDYDDNVYYPNHAFTILYSGDSSFRFKWGTNWSVTTRLGKKMTNTRYMYSNVPGTAIGEYLFYTKNKPAQTNIPVPKKTVSHTSNISLSEPIKYTIKHTVPQEPSEHYYANYKIVDDVDSAIENPGVVSIKNQDGSNVSSWFTTTKSGTKLTIAAKADTLKKAAFYGETYTIEISGKLNSNELRKKVGSNANYTIKNQAVVTVNNKNYTSNSVNTKVDKYTLTIKHVDKDDGKVLKTETKPVFIGEKYSAKPLSTFKTAQGYAYRPVSESEVTGTVTGNNTITVQYEKPRKMTVNYVNDDNDSLIRKIETWATWYYDEDTTKNTGEGTRYDGDQYSFTALKEFAMPDGKRYKFVKYDQENRTSPQWYRENNNKDIGNIELTVRYTPARDMTTRHIDKDTGELILSETVKNAKFDGEQHMFTPKSDLKFKNKYLYRLVDNTSSSFVLNPVKGNYTHDFYYTKVAASVGIKSASIDTAKASSDMPVNIKLSVEAINDRWKDKQVSITAYVTEEGKMPKDVTTGTNPMWVMTSPRFYTLGELGKQGNSLNLLFNEKATNAFYSPKGYNSDVLSNGNFTTGSKNPELDPNKKYDVKFLISGSGSSKEMQDIDIVQNAKEIQLPGYTASEKVLKQTAVKNGKVEYKGVVRTERVLGQNVKEYFEKVTLPLNKISSVKSGYGFELNQEMQYTNDLGLEKFKPATMKALVDSEALDGDFYKVKNGTAEVETTTVNTTSGKTITQKFHYPKVYVEENDGTIFSEKQRKDGDSQINNDLIDGGNKLYVPIWIEELGSYDHILESSTPIGVNEIQVVINDKIDVSAYMYATIGSETILEDELLMQPIYPDSTKPENWSKEELDWLSK